MIFIAIPEGGSVQMGNDWRITGQKSDCAQLMEPSSPTEKGGSEALKIRRFDPKVMPPDATVLLVGKRRTGKSTLLIDLMWNMRKKIDLVMGMNPTEEASKVL